MTTIAPIDRVIRHVNKNTEPNGDAEKIVTFDTKDRVVLDRIPFFGFLMDLRYYLVCNSSDPRNMAQSEVTGQALQSVDLRLPVSMSYSVRCRPGHEGRAVLALYVLGATGGALAVLVSYISAGAALVVAVVVIAAMLFAVAMLEKAPYERQAAKP